MVRVKRKRSQLTREFFFNSMFMGFLRTTFKILTGELNSTSGNAYINGYDINKNRFNARRSLGYCPQFDYLPEYLTVEESLTLFAKLRGLDDNGVKLSVSDLIKVFKLGEFSKKLVQNLR